MSESAASSITDYAIATDETWFEVPSSPGIAESWARSVVGKTGVTNPAAGMLLAQLGAFAERAAQQVGDAGTVAVWLPLPESGYPACAMAVTVWDVGSGGYVDTSVFESVEVVEDTLYQRTWRGEIAAGPFAAIHRLTLRPQADAQEHHAVETTEFAVFPAGVGQFVQLVFTAESVSAFEDMPTQTEALVRGLSLTCGGTP